MYISDLFRHNWLILSIATKGVRDALTGYAKGALLDVGCGTKPHKDYIEMLPSVSRYTGIDRDDSCHLGDGISADISGDAYNLPAKDKFDTVLCSWVLEHLEEPEAALREMYRVMEDDGVLILSTNFIWHLHEVPRDFYRFSPYGLRYLLEKVGFEVLELEALTGFWVTFGQELAYYVYKFSSNALLKPFLLALTHVIQVCSLVLEKFSKDERYAANYLVVARKN